MPTFRNSFRSSARIPSQVEEKIFPDPQKNVLHLRNTLKRVRIRRGNFQEQKWVNSAERPRESIMN
jgi:hypothetical protein